MLYLRVVELGWFRESPSSMRWTGKAIGFFIIVMGCSLSGVFGYGLGWGLVFLPVVVVGIAVLMMSGKFGKRRPGPGAWFRALSEHRRGGRVAFRGRR